MTLDDKLIGLEDALTTDTDVDGYLEWASGLMFVNRTRPEWDALFERVNDNPFDYGHGQLKRTILHETFHFYQIVTTGYLYRFVTELFGVLTECLGEGSTRTERIHALNAGASVAVPARLIQTAAGLDVPGPAGLTVRNIVESAAYLYEFRAEYPDFGAGAYAEQLAIEDPPTDYRAAYDILREALGDAAFDALLPAALVALCFEEPPRAFQAAADAMGGEPSSGFTAPDTLAGLQRLASAVRRRECRPLGSAAEVAFGPDGHVRRHHPVYLDAIAQLNSGLLASGPLLMMLDPTLMLASLDQMMRPLCLRDRAIWLPPAAWAQRDTAGLRHQLQALRIIAALSRRLQNHLTLPRPRSKR